MIKIDKEKIEKLNSNNFYILADFDNTITSKESKSSMGVINNSEVFDINFRNEHNELCIKYKEKAIHSKDYSVKNEMWNKTLRGFFELFKKYNLTEDLLKEIVNNSNIRFREGFENLFKFLYEKNIPVIIVSAGVKNCIEMFLQKYNAFYDNIEIISNQIEFDDNGHIKKFPEFIINPANKNKVVFSEDIKLKIRGRENIVLLRRCTRRY